VAKRINAIMPDSVYETLSQLAQDKGTSMSDVLRDAIGLEQWFAETRRSGARVLVEREGTVREVIPR
jgi:hypothetical protein